MPQALYMWAVGRDMVNLESKKELLILSGAITATLSKNGRQILRRLNAMFDGPQKSLEQMYEELSDIQKLVLFGSQQNAEQNGSQTDTN